MRLVYLILDLIDIAPLIRHDYDDLGAFGGHLEGDRQFHLVLVAASHYMELLYTGNIIETIFYL